VLGLGSSFNYSTLVISTNISFFPIYELEKHKKGFGKRRDKSLQNEEDELLGDRSLLLKGKKGGDMVGGGEG
jgi:hypothetical protein